MTDARVVLVTAPGEEEAVALCRSLVDERLVACGNVVPGVRSIYRWKDEVHDEREVLVVLKTDRARVARLVERIPEIHPYEVPEVLVLPVEAGNPPYLRWLAEESRPRRAQGTVPEGGR